MREGGVVTLAHGGGGAAMRRLVDEAFLSAFGGSTRSSGDSALLDASPLAPGERLAFTTDAHVVDPIFFPGGDLGRLAVCGTINDLAVAGARPIALSCAAVIEEGFPVADLKRIARSMASSAREAGVRIVTGDTKVVGRGAADGLFVTTSGVGIVPSGRDLGFHRVRADDAVLVSGPLGAHAATVLAARGDLGLDADLVSDVRPLGAQIEALLAAVPDTRFMRDATRGGVAAVLCEAAEACGLGIAVEEDALPVPEAVRGVSELLGLEPVHLANEGVFVAIVPASGSGPAVAALRASGAPDAAVVGRVVKRDPGLVVMRTALGGERLVDLPEGDPLPRIC